MVDPQSEQVMLKLSPLTFPCVIAACFKSHPPLFDRSRLDFTTRLFRYSDKLPERNYLMTYQAERIEKGSNASLKTFSVFSHSFQGVETDRSIGS